MALSALFILGLIIGSFLNALIFRLHSRESIARGRSKCRTCGHVLSPLDLFPVFSFLFLKGRCRYCGDKISWQYPLVEIVTALMFLFFGYYRLAFLPEVNWWLLARDLMAASSLILIFVYDWRYMEIPDEASLPAIAICFLLGVIGGISWSAILVSALIGGGFFAVQYLLSRGRWLGGGDLRLGVLMGILLSWPSLILAIMLAYIAGASWGVYLLATKKANIGSAVPLGVFLAPATIFSMVFGTQLVDWYLTFLR